MLKSRHGLRQLKTDFSFRSFPAFLHYIILVTYQKRKKCNICLENDLTFNIDRMPKRCHFDKAHEKTPQSMIFESNAADARSLGFHVYDQRCVAVPGLLCPSAADRDRQAVQGPLLRCD